jgi:hypothetical protein
MMARTGTIRHEELLSDDDEREARERLAARLRSVRQSREKAIWELLTGRAQMRRNQLAEQLRKSG